MKKIITKELEDLEQLTCPLQGPQFNSRRFNQMITQVPPPRSTLFAWHLGWITMAGSRRAPPLPPKMEREVDGDHLSQCQVPGSYSPYFPLPHAPGSITTMDYKDPFRKSLRAAPSCPPPRPQSPAFLSWMPSVASQLDPLLPFLSSKNPFSK